MLNLGESSAKAAVVPGGDGSAGTVGRSDETRAYELCVHPWAAMPIHRHTQTEVLFVLDGSMLLFFNEPQLLACFGLSRGTGICVPAGMPHSYRNASAAELSVATYYVDCSRQLFGSAILPNLLNEEHLREAEREPRRFQCELDGLPEAHNRCGWLWQRIGQVCRA
jgi:mannose-6-phosphate isomerase-like protein (cupin superfamily)